MNQNSADVFLCSCLSKHAHLYYLGDAIPVDAIYNLKPELNDTNEYPIYNSM